MTLLRLVCLFLILRESVADEASPILDSSDPPPRINGGQLVNETVPFQVSLQMQRRGRWQHFCGGSIVSAQHVLTAAHCMEKMKVEDVSVVIGTLNWKSGGVRHRVLAKHVHPQYSMSPRIINDIALVRVTPPFRLERSNIATIQLGGSDRIGEKVPVRLTGWGSTTPSTSSATLPDKLQSLNYRTISNEECNQKGFRVTRNEICALAIQGQGACVGDSGGPLIKAGPHPHLVGIVSYGSSTCAQGRPDVYTRVSSFLAYIAQVINQDLAQ
ncbi:chymotrypsin-1 [Drosophila serrata]|uniref:chymotrypsin-1 n=1 Tax=Drosophila serrata TaxID=7274 RepID=UPI000A1D0497|nr:chymotrypsin-1 [Drosophila serrata]